jgi:hypothetical protein
VLVLFRFGGIIFWLTAVRRFRVRQVRLVRIAASASAVRQKKLRNHLELAKQSLICLAIQIATIAIFVFNFRRLWRSLPWQNAIVLALSRLPIANFLLWIRIVSLFELWGLAGHLL